MNKEIEKLVKDLEQYLSQGRVCPSRLDLVAVPEAQEQDYRNAIERVFNAKGVRCPDIRFGTTDEQTRVNEKINDIIAEAKGNMKNGEDFQIRVDFKGYENVVSSQLRLLMARLRNELGYKIIDGSRENIYNEEGKHIAAVLKFEQVSPKN